MVIAGACNPVHAADIAALGGEAADVPEGPLHRPGQPCTVCHDGAIGDPSAFSVAGTVYPMTSSPTGEDGVTVTMTDSKMQTYASTTNAAGNFYVRPKEWTPAFPIERVVVQHGSQAAQMYSRISWSSSCGWCHVAPASQSSPGHVALLLDDGGTPL